MTSEQLGHLSYALIAAWFFMVLMYNWQRIVKERSFEEGVEHGEMNAALLFPKYEARHIVETRHNIETIKKIFSIDERMLKHMGWPLEDMKQRAFDEAKDAIVNHARNFIVIKKSERYSDYFDSYEAKLMVVDLTKGEQI